MLRFTQIQRLFLHPFTKALDFQGLFVFLGKKHTPFTIELLSYLLDLNLRLFALFATKLIVHKYNLI
jgi:hypothetical protein